VLVDELRQKCLEERLDGPGASHYSSLSMAPEEWTLEAGRPCSGERLLLMFDR
jgi:inositol hexakisphosphate/diphosphoinositol-pentakisphosphate kinase